MFVLGVGPLIDLSGVLRPAREALALVSLAWTSALLPIAALASCAVMVSVVTRSSAAGIGLPVIWRVVHAAVDTGRRIGARRRLLVTSAFDAWHVLLTDPASYRPLFDASVVSVTYALVSLVIAYWTLQRRDIGG